jgi:hypothetical protein
VNPDTITPQIIAHACECLRSSLLEMGPEIAKALLEDPEQTHSFRAGFKLTIVKERLYMQGKTGHTTKGETEFESSFDLAPDLPGIEKEGGAK